jgi:hypothetical protein
MSELMTPEEIAAVKARDALYSDADMRTGYTRAIVIDDRRALLAHVKAQAAEIERLRAQLASRPARTCSRCGSSSHTSCPVAPWETQ